MSGGTRLDEIVVASGVPQGSLLVQLLFAKFTSSSPICSSSHVQLVTDLI